MNVITYDDLLHVQDRAILRNAFTQRDRQRAIHPINGIGPGLVPSAREQAIKREQARVRREKRDRQRERAIGYAKGFAAARYAEAARDLANEARVERTVSTPAYNGPVAHA